MIYFEQLNIRKLLNLMENAGEMTAVHEDYLCGMEKDEFISAYKSLYQLFKQIYADMMADPSIFFLPLCRIDEGQSGDKTKA